MGFVVGLLVTILSSIIFGGNDLPAFINGVVIGVIVFIMLVLQKVIWRI